MATSPETPQKYSYTNWLSDCEWFFAAQEEFDRKGLSGFPMDQFESHFEAQYGDTALFHRLRFRAAMQYVARHIDSLDIPGFPKTTGQVHALRMAFAEAHAKELDSRSKQAPKRKRSS